MQVGIASRALNHAEHNGDQCACWRIDGKVFLCVVDGLGHGKEAEKAANAALNCVAQHLSESLSEIFSRCDSALRGTRGVAMGIAVLDLDKGTLSYVGIGNTRILIHGANTTRLSGNYGIVGGGYRFLSTETRPIHPGDLVIMFTDGLPQAIDASGYDDALRSNVQGLSEKILEDWGRKTDDAAVLVVRNVGEDDGK